MLQAAVHALDNSTLYQKCTQVGIIRKPIAGGDGSVPSSAKSVGPPQTPSSDPDRK
jgi:hypothetical protein